MSGFIWIHPIRRKSLHYEEINCLIYWTYVIIYDPKWNGITILSTFLWQLLLFVACNLNNAQILNVWSYFTENKRVTVEINIQGSTKEGVFDQQNLIHVVFAFLCGDCWDEVVKSFFQALELVWVLRGRLYRLPRQRSPFITKTNQI